MDKRFHYALGALVLLVALSLLVVSGIADFTTPLLDGMTKLLNANSMIHTGEHTLNNTGFWTGFYLQLVMDTWLFSPNWWIVLLSAAVLVGCAFWVANFLCDKDAMTDMCEELCGSFEIKPVVNLGWLRFVYASIGVYLSFGLDYENSLINTAVIVAPFFLTYLLLWNSYGGWGAVTTLIPTTIIWLLGMFIAIIVASISWIAIILIIWGLFKSIFSMGSGYASGGNSSSKYTNPFSWTGYIPNFRTDPTGTVGYDDNNNEYYKDANGYWHRR